MTWLNSNGIQRHVGDFDEPTDDELKPYLRGTERQPYVRDLSNICADCGTAIGKRATRCVRHARIYSAGKRTER